MRRVGGGQQEPYALPHQAQDAIRGFFWVEDPVHPAINGYKGHVKLACDQMFVPQLRVETVLGGEPLEPVVEQRPPRWGSPIHFIIKLPQGAGDCFKVGGLGCGGRPRLGRTGHVGAMDGSAAGLQKPERALAASTLALCKALASVLGSSVAWHHTAP